MEKIQDFTSLQQIPSAVLNDFQDAAAPKAPFIGYKRGGFLRTLSTTHIGISPIILCTGTDAEDVDSIDTETDLDTTGATAVDMWHYVYAGIYLGALTFYIFKATDPDPQPDAATYWRDDGSDFYRYLGCFYRSTALGILPFYQTATEVIYRKSQVADATFRFVNNHAAGTFTVSLATLVPPHARTVRVSMHIESGLGLNSIAVRGVGDGFDQNRVYTPVFNAAGAEMADGVSTVECDASNQIDVDLVLNAPSNNQAYVTGFLERRV